VRDYTGQKIGLLNIIKRIGSKMYHPPNGGRCATYAVWEAICDCGNHCEVDSNRLNNRRAKSCGCLRKKWTCQKGRIRQGYENGQAAKNKVLDYYKRAAFLRSIEWQITDEQFLSLCLQNCHYCNQPPSKVKKTASGVFVYNGVDRKDNSRGYTLENVVSCCEICNLAKRDLSYDVFVSWLKNAGRYQLGEK
jgi:hypothetical protein